jgi:hypothetical protein
VPGIASMSAAVRTTWNGLVTPVNADASGKRGSTPAHIASALAKVMYASS